ncbi:MAG: chemotaxis protein CheB [Desulforhopalus sp.]
MTNPYIIVIGASKGGINALSRLVSFFPDNLPAAIFIVQHSSPDYKSHLDEILSTKGVLPVIQPQNGEKIKSGTIYVAPSNRHLVIKDNHVTIPFGPHENRVRPSIDVLFRSAAAHHTSRVIAVLLTGYLDDGVSGLFAVKRCGGTVIVQDPDDAEVPDLPRNAIRFMEIDHILPLKEIAAQLIDTVHQPVGDAVEVPEEIMTDIKVSEHTVPGLERMKNIGTITPFTCPDCGGTMWDAKNEPAGRLVCHTGHSFTMDSFLKGQAEVIEDSLWAAIRFFDERIKILENMAEKENQKKYLQSTESYRKKIKELKYHMHILRDFIVSGGLTISN